MVASCAISLRFTALSVVAVGRHSLSPMPTFPVFLHLRQFDVVFSMYPQVIHKSPIFWSTYYGSLDHLKILSRRSEVGACIQRHLQVSWA